MPDETRSSRRRQAQSRPRPAHQRANLTEARISTIDGQLKPAARFSREQRDADHRGRSFARALIRGAVSAPGRAALLGDIGAQLGGDRPSSYYAGMMEAPESFGSRQEIERWLRQWSLYAKLPPRGMAIVLREHFQKARDGRWRWRFGGRLRELQSTQPREVLFPTPVARAVADPLSGAHRARGSERLAAARGRGADARGPPRRAPRGDSRLQPLSVPGAAA
jgi:hypothetical protein